MNLTRNKYYWVKDDSNYHHKYVALYLNNEGEWKIEVYGSTKFVSTDTIKRLFGKDSILREVDFENDIAKDQKLEVPVRQIGLLSDTKAPLVMRANTFGMDYNGMFVPETISGKILEYKE